MRRNSGIINNAPFRASLSSASGVFDSFDAFAAQKSSSWPITKKYLNIKINNSTSPLTLNEGDTFSVSVSVEGENGSTLYYTIAGVGGSITTADFTDSSISGSFVILSNTGVFNKTLLLDGTNESEDAFQVQVRTDSISGPIVLTSQTITIANPSFSITPSSSSFNEGTSISWNVATTNVSNGTTLYYSYVGVPANTIDIASPLTGSFIINSNSGSFTTTAANDFTTEGSEILTAYVRIGSVSGIVAATNTVTINDTSLTPTATVTPSSSSIDEGSSVTFTVNTTNFTSGTLNWETILSGEMETSDISPTSGTVTISGSTGSIVITATSDGFTETGQTESFQVRVFSPAPGNPVLATSSAVTINDISTGIPEPLGVDITSSFYEISNRHIDSDIFMNGSSVDYTGPYDVGQVATSFVGSGRVYIAVKITPVTTFYGDIPIAGVQVLNSAGDTLIASWIFNSISGGSGSTWQTYTSQIPGTSTIGFPVSPATASAYTYVDIGSGATVGRFTLASSTSSSFTGAADGITSTYDTTIAPVGDAQIPQALNTFYAYAETSGATRYTGVVMRGPAISFSGGEKIRVIHALTGYSGSPMDPNDSIYVAVY